VTPNIVVLCTGNAARSVMVGAMLASRRVPARVTTAGTHALEHQPMSRRTRDALVALGVEVPSHRSQQLTESVIDGTDLVMALAGEHVRYVRRHHPGAAQRTATLRWLADHLPEGPEALGDRVVSLGLAYVDAERQGDVDDPAGGDDDTYARCAAELWALVEKLAPRLG
jgi:protein-tyrosine-phosphatase